MLSSSLPSLADSLHMIFSGTPPAGQTWDVISGPPTRPDAYRAVAESHDQRDPQEPCGVISADAAGNGWATGSCSVAFHDLAPRDQLAHPGEHARRTVAGRRPVLGDRPETRSPPSTCSAAAPSSALFFIATDPVSASTTPRGQLIYGALIGLLVFTIRTWGGVLTRSRFSVLLLNMAAPTIDYYTQPRIFGQRKGSDA